MEKNIEATTILYNGYIYTADDGNTIYEAIAIKDGYIAAVGTTEEIRKMAGKATEQIDLQGKMAMPGLIDSHLHPLWGGKSLINPSLNYESLSIKETLAKLNGFLEQDPGKNNSEDDWLIVQSWLRAGGTDITCFDLDTLPTKRPIMLCSNDFHSIALNGRGLQILGITKGSTDDADGLTARLQDGTPTGIVQDAPAMRIFDRVTSLSAAPASEVLAQTQRALNEQGVTTIMDARAIAEEFDAFLDMREKNRLTLRVAAAVEIPPLRVSDLSNVEPAYQELLAFRKKYAPHPWSSPGADISVSHVKFFIDGMLPNKTAFVLEPYFENTGSEEKPELRQTDYRARSYYTQTQLDALFLSAAQHNFHPHMHIIADGAADITLNAIARMRTAHPAKDIRPSMAHNDLMNPQQYNRFKTLDTIATLSFQWCAMPESMLPLFFNVVGKKRFDNDLETHGKFFDAGVIVAYGSDWPIDPLNEWYNLQCGLTRRISKNDPRLDSDRNLTVLEVLRAATINAAYALQAERYIGSLEKGKFADIIVLDRNPFFVSADNFAQIKVLRTILGGKTVHLKN
ncbi:MAG: amidohydrolase [Puniceicoccales bacterium]|jgi:predicted amidohydrolase YtcJ|nr:amidohydrolase [Puniceicoccales bacterium]